MEPNQGPQGARRAYGACAQRGARTCAVAGAGPRAGLRGGWAAARAVDVFGGCGGGAALGGDRGRGAEPGSGSALERARPEWSSGREPAGEPCVPGNGSAGRLSGGPWGGEGSGLAAGERRVRPGWACGGAPACFGVPRVDPTPPALRPCRRRLPRVALAEGRSLSLKRCARPTPGSTSLERLGFRGRQGLIVTRRASVPNPRR